MRETTQKRNTRIMKMFLKGYQPSYLAERFGLTLRSIHHITRGLPRDRTLRLPDFAQIKREYLAGYAPSHIATKRGHSSEVVRRELLAAGLPLRPLSHYLRSFSDAEEMRMADLYVGGATLAEIALEFGTGDKSQIANILERLGVPRRTSKESRDLRGTWNTGPRQSVVEYP